MAWRLLFVSSLLSSIIIIIINEYIAIIGPGPTFRRSKLGQQGPLRRGASRLAMDAENYNSHEPPEEATQFLPVFLSQIKLVAHKQLPQGVLSVRGLTI